MLGPLLLLAEGMQESSDGKWGGIFAESTLPLVEEAFDRLPNGWNHNFQILKVPDPRVLFKVRSLLRAGGSVFVYADNDEGSVRPSEPILALGRMRNWGHGAAQMHRLFGAPIVLCAVISSGQLPFTVHFEPLPDMRDLEVAAITERLAASIADIETKYGVGWGLRGALLNEQF